MPFVRDFRGVGEDLFIKLNRTPTYDDLWEIIGFCRRYGTTSLDQVTIGV